MEHVAAGRGRQKAAADLPRGSAADDPVAVTQETLSARIRMLRQKRGLSIATLARQAGVTSAMVSQVERGVTNPSLATVTRISTALGVTVSELFEVETPGGLVVRFQDRRVINYPDKDTVDAFISSDPTRQLQVLESRIGPHQGSEGQLGPHGANVEFVLVLGGEIEFLIGDATHLLAEGDAITFDGRLAHGFINHTNESVRLIWVTTPATF